MIKDNLTITVYDVMIKDNCYQKRIAIMPMQWIPRTVHGWLVSPDHDDDEYMFVCLFVYLFVCLFLSLVNMSVFVQPSKRIPLSPMFRFADMKKGTQRSPHIPVQCPVIIMF